MNSENITKSLEQSLQHIVFLIGNTATLVKIQIAPRLYIIDQISHMLGQIT